MMNEKISTRHLKLTAYVYVRQSSPGQEKKNVESKRRQLEMHQHAENLGWQKHLIKVVGGDSGTSGSSLHGRDDYQEMFEAASLGQVGIFFVSELSRLIRDNQDWNQLVRVCRYKDVLLGDGHRIYNAIDPQDRVLLGIQGAFTEYELSLIKDRMLTCLNQKARRGELYEAFSPGYICRKSPLYEKHPEERVQRAVRYVFEEFNKVASVLKLHERFLEQSFKLPVVPHGQDWREVEWVPPTYHQLLRMLKNPVYAGIYARGRTETIIDLDPQGNAQKKRYRVPREQWKIFIENHHETFISKATWEKNLKKIAANANMNGTMVKRSPQHGNSLVAGLIRCRRCSHKMHVTHAKEQIRYVCRGGKTQREKVPHSCFSFSAKRPESRLIEHLLYAIGPAGIEAAKLAAEQLEAQQAQQRQLLLDRIEAQKEKTDRAEREYKKTDLTYQAVRQILAAEWEQALLALAEEKARLETFDKEKPLQLTLQQEQKLQQLGEDLERVWFHPKADQTLKKQIVRVLIEEIIADVDEKTDEIVWIIHWAGGHHTELREPRRIRLPRSKPKQLKTIIDTLRKVSDDKAIAIALNRKSLSTPKGESWTTRKVQVFRKAHHIPFFNTKEKKKHGWLSLAETAILLDISPMSVTRLIQTGVLPSEQPFPGLPAVVMQKKLKLDPLKKVVHHIKTSNNRPLSQHPNQLSLFNTTNS